MKAQNEIKGYILASIEFYDHKEDLLTNEEDKIKELMRRFESEYWYYDNQQRYNGSIVRALASWLQGLPSDINIAFEYWEIDQLLTTWGYIKPNSSDSKIEKERKNYWLYIAGSIVAMSYQ